MHHVAMDLIKIVSRRVGGQGPVRPPDALLCHCEPTFSTVLSFTGFWMTNCAQPVATELTSF